MFGAAGKDITLRFPVGTIIADQATGGVLHELLVPGERIVLAKRVAMAGWAICALKVPSIALRARKLQAAPVSASVCS